MLHTDQHGGCQVRTGVAHDEDRAVELMKINFVTNIAAGEISGGFSGMNAAAFHAMEQIAQVNYVGPISPPVSVAKKVISKAMRLVGIPAEYYFFSDSRLKQIALEVERLSDQNADLDFYHGYTPWIRCRRQRPYVAWSDCSFHDYIHIYHDSSKFSHRDIERVCQQEREWLSNADAILVTSAWQMKRIIERYSLPPDKVRFVGIFGAMEPPEQIVNPSAKDFYFISTNYKTKNGNLCRQAMDIVWRKYPEARLRIIGDRPPDSDLVTDKVTYEGWFRKSDPAQLKILRSHFASAFALLLPTDADISPLTAIEAAMFGCPAISVDDFALREVTAPENWKYLMSRPLRAEGIAEKMIELLDSGTQYASARMHAREFSVNNQTVERFTERLKDQVVQAVTEVVSRAGV
jgi:glycosyltransferase involved in cell wall biosynthesis